MRVDRAFDAFNRSQTELVLIASGKVTEVIPEVVKQHARMFTDYLQGNITLALETLDESRHKMLRAMREDLRIDRYDFEE